MKKIILASHGELAQGMKQTASMIIGSEAPIYALSAFRDEDEPMIKQLETLLQEIGTKDIYIVTDILGGSVNNDVLQLLSKYPELTVLTGMNLALVITLATQSDSLSSDALNQIIEDSRQAIVDCKQLLTQQMNAGGDEL